MLLRFAEQYLLARHFGPSHTLDAYFVAQTLILIASQCAVAVTSAAVPVITARIKTEDEDVQQADFTVAAFVVLGCVFLALVLTAAAPLLVRLFGAGLDEPSRRLAGFLLYCSIPEALLSMAAAAFRAHWHAHQNLLLPGLLQLLMPLVSTALAALVAADLLGIAWVPIGAGFGAFLFALALAVPFFRHAASRTKLWNPSLAKEFGRALFPVSLAMMLIPCMIAVGRFFASRLPAGNVSALSVAASLMSIPGQLAATSVGITILPRTSTLFSGNQQEAAASLIERAIRLTVFCSMPFSLAFALYPDGIVQTVFHSSAFNAGAVHLTSLALLGYCAGIPALGAMQVLVFALFAASAWRKVAGVTLFSFVINIVFSIVAGRSILGISGAFSLSCGFSVVVLAVLLRRIVPLSLPGLLTAAAKAAGASAVSFGAIYLARSWGWMQTAPSAVLLLASFAAYAGVAAVLCRAEMREFFGLLRLGKTPGPLKDESSLAQGAP